MELTPEVLRTFVAAVRVGSFTRAAGQVNLSQSAVSVQMRGLERELGHSLFVRGKNGVEPTWHGRILYSYARRILDIHEEALCALDASGRSTLVRIGVPADYADVCLCKTLKTFVRAMPQARMVVVTGSSPQLLDDVRKDRLDLAVCRGAGAEGGQSLCCGELVWVGTSRCLPVSGKSLPLILPDDGCAVRSMVLRVLEDAGLSYHMAFSCSNRASAVAVARMGAAVCVLPACLAPRELRHPALQQALPRLPAPEVFLHRAAGPLSSPAFCLAEILLSHRHGPNGRGV